jgi:hypothetical protein
MDDTGVTATNSYIDSEIVGRLKEGGMNDIDQILRLNPKAAEGIDAIRKAIDALNDLRKLGVASSSSGMAIPYGGRRNLEKLKRRLMSQGGG